MIPKIIHYCWFGEKKLPDSALYCIQSWKRYMPDYEIKEWNESNYIIRNEYAKEAYSRKKYAFVSDVARLDIIYNAGGIYLDTDVELIKSLESIVSKGGYLGFQKSLNNNEYLVNTGLGFAAEKENQIIGSLLKDYDNIKFVKPDGSLDVMSCPTRNSKRLMDIGVRLDNSLQRVGNMIIYPSDYFCPMDESSGDVEITNNTVSVHRFDASWLTGNQKIKRRARQLIGVENWNKLKRIVK